MVDSPDRLQNMLRFAIPEPHTPGVDFGALFANALREVWPDSRVVQRSAGDLAKHRAAREALDVNSKVPHKIDAVTDIAGGAAFGYRILDTAASARVFATPRTTREPQMEAQYLVMEIPTQEHDGGSTGLHRHVLGSKDFCVDMLSAFEKHYGGLANNEELRDVLKQGLRQFMTLPMLLEIDADLSRYPAREWVDFDAPFGSRHTAGGDPVALLEKGRLFDFLNDLTDYNQDAIDEATSAVVASVSEEAFDASTAEAMEELLGVDASTLKSELRGYTDEALMERGGAVEYKPRGVAHLVFDAQCEICFDGVTSSPFNAILDDDFLQMLEMLRIRPSDWAKHLVTEAGYQGNEGIQEYLAPLIAAEAENPARWQFAQSPMIGCSSLCELLLNANSDSSLVFSSCLDWEQLCKLEPIYEQRSVPRAVSVDGVAVHLHNYSFGSGHFVGASAPLVLAAGIGKPANALHAAFAGPNEDFEFWQRDDTRVVNIHNDVKLDCGIAAVWGRYPTSDTGVIVDALPLLPTQDINLSQQERSAPVLSTPTPE